MTVSVAVAAAKAARTEKAEKVAKAAINRRATNYPKQWSC